MDDKLRSILYPTKEDNYSEAEIKKIVCDTVRKHIIKNDYKIIIDNYYIDLRPNSLSVEYKTKDSIIEISNKEIIFETVRNIPKMSFVISKEAKEEYRKDRNHLEVEGIVVQKGNECIERYDFRLFSTKDDDIKRYLQLGDGFEYIEQEGKNLNRVAISRKINKESKYPKILSFFNTNSIRPVVFKDNSYYAASIEPKKNYDDLLPSLEHEKDMIRIIYSTIIEYYDNYINKL